MDRFMRWAMSALLVAALTLLPATSATAAMRAAADDDVPGDPLAALPATFSGTLDAASDTDDVYYLDLQAGEVLDVSITGPASAYFDMDLFGPGTTSIADPAAPFLDTTDATGDGSPYDPYPYELQYRSPVAQRVYLDVYAVDGVGGYSATWRVITENANDDIPGEPLGTTSRTGWAGDMSDPADVYSLALAEGDVLSARTLTTSGSLRIWTSLYRGDAASVATDYQVAYSAAGVKDGSLTYVVPPGGAGTYYLEVRATLYAGDYRLTVTHGPAGVVRLAGATRYETALAIAGSTATTVPVAVVATARSYPDALSAAGLAGAYRGSLLLVDRDSVPFAAMCALANQRPQRIVVVGGTGAVSAAAERALAGFSPKVERLAGADRYATAHAAATRIAEQAGPSQTAFLVRGDSFPDALSVAPLAYHLAAPVLLTPRASLDAGAREVLRSAGVTHVVIAGGTGAVAAGVASAVASLGDVEVTRLAGADRYGTAALVARYGEAQGWVTPTWVGVATGADFPDALAGGVGCGRMGGVLLLTAPQALSAPTASALRALGPAGRIAVLGGPHAVSGAVFDALGGYVAP